MEQDFTVNLTEEGVFLMVPPDSTATLSDILSAIKEKGVEEYTGQAVKAAFEQKTGRSVRIAEPHKEEAREADFRLRVSEDGLSCEMWYIPESGGAPAPTVEKIKGYMNGRSVVFGHDEEAIKSMLETPILRQWVVTARGTPPVQGKDAAIEYKVDLNVLKPKAVGDRVDMKELGAVINVVKGQEIAVKTAVVQGKDGMTVGGKKIAAYMGKDKNLPVGKGTVATEDKLQMFADVDGNLYIKDGKLNINPVFEVKGDVDYGVGNIDFIGPVTVIGSIREGFEVSAGSDLRVEGVVEGATVSSSGNMYIRVGVSGNGKARITTKGNLETGYIDQGYVRSDGNIVVTDAIRHSDVGARGEIQAQGKKGIIVGGKIHAGSEVVCDVLGGEMGTKTEVFVGELPELAEERRRSEENVKQLQEQADKIEANLTFLKDLQQKGALTPDKQELMAKITKAKFQVKAQYDATAKRLAELEEEREKNRLEGRVRVKGTCYSGVSITIRGTRYLVREEHKYVRFVYEDGEVKIKPFDY